MSKSSKRLFIFISAVVFVLTCFWYFKEKGWEPLAAMFVAFSALITALLQKVEDEDAVSTLSPVENHQRVEQHQNVQIHTVAAIIPPTSSERISQNLEDRKKLTNILFVDDDTKFKVVSILKTAGWINTKAVKDIGNLDEQYVKDAHIIFVDVQGVGKLLQTRDEGLGLALILKRKYSSKYIIIYSAQTEGDRFHEALRKADASLAKNAEPYEFQQLVEQFSEEMH